MRALSRVHSHRARIPQREERGSLVVILAVISVMVVLASYLFVQVVGNQQIIGSRQNTYAGVAGADAALSDALFRLDQSNEVGTTGVFCYNPASSHCHVTADPSATHLNGVRYLGYTVPANSAPSTANQWTVQAIGNASTGFAGAVQETLTRAALFPYAVFGKRVLQLSGDTRSGSGSNGVDFGSYIGGTSGSFAACSDTVVSPPCLAVGSDGSVICTGNSPAQVQSIWFNTASSAAGCGGSFYDHNYNYPVSAPNAPSNSQPCPGVTLGTDPFHRFLGSAYGQPTLGPGVYKCGAGQLEIGGTLTMTSTTPNNPVQLYVITGGSSASWITFDADAQINSSISYSQMTTSSSKGGFPQPADIPPDSRLFQLFTDSKGILTTNGTHGYVFGGVLYGPDSSLDNNGCKSFYFGSVTVYTFTCNGGPNLGVYYDKNLNYLYGSWQVSGYQQVNPATVQANFPTTG